MADGSHTTMTLEAPVDGGLIAGLRSFAGDHGGAKAVIEYVGRRGCRIVLVGGAGGILLMVAQLLRERTDPK